MRTNRKTAALLAWVTLLALMACTANPKPVTSPLPTGARDTADANAFRIIADAHAFLQSIENSVNAKTLTLNAAQKQAFNDTVIAYNSAYAAGMLYHNGTNTNPTDLNNATANLSTKLTAAKVVLPQ